MPVRVAAISFLNPAPLLYNFEHEPAATALRSRYDVHYTSPARCAAELLAGEADLGLIPIAELTPELRVVPGCTIASLHEVRSILLLVRSRVDAPEDALLRGLRRVAADTASRSSVAYLRTILKRFYDHEPVVETKLADPLGMLADHDAALLIGDPALLARERRQQIDSAVEQRWGDRLYWLDIATLWRRLTGLPWVAAVWAIRPEVIQTGEADASLLCADLEASKQAGLQHTDDLVAEWLPRLALSAATIRTYLTQNIYYHLDAPCLDAVRIFRAMAAQTGTLPPLPALRMLET